jgi:protein-tyrosine-phosphatase
MKLALAQYTSAEIRKETRFFIDFSDDMEGYFLKKKYGNDLMEIVIGIICVSPIFEQFFKLKAPKYIKEKKHIKSEGFEYEVEKCLEYSIKLDFETFKNSSEVEAKKHLAQEILKSLDTIETMKSKIKDFDLINFKKDLEKYFKEKGLI